MRKTKIVIDTKILLTVITVAEICFTDDFGGFSLVLCIFYGIYKAYE